MDRLPHYGLNHLPEHLCRLGRLDEAVALVTGSAFLAQKRQVDGPAETVRVLSRVAAVCRQAGNETLAVQVEACFGEVIGEGAAESGEVVDRECVLEGLFAVAPRRGWLACGAADGSVRVWDVRGGRLVRVLKGLDDRVSCVAFDGEGVRVVAGSVSGMVCTWGEDGELGLELHGPPEAVAEVRFNAGAQVLARTVSGAWHVWDAATGDKVVCLWDLEQVPGGSPDDVLAVLVRLEEALLAAGQQGAARYLLEAYVRRQVLPRLEELGAATGEVAIGILERAWMACPGEARVGVRLAKVLAAEQRWVRLYPLLERVGRLELEEELRDQVEGLRRVELVEFHAALPVAIGEAEWPGVRRRLMQLQRRFGGEAECLVVRCRAIAAYVGSVLGEGAATKRLVRLAKEYREAKRTYYGLVPQARTEALTAALKRSEAGLGEKAAKLLGVGAAGQAVKGRLYGESGSVELSLGGVMRQIQGLERDEQVRVVREDQKARWERGERVRAEDYKQCEPALGQTIVRELVVGEVGLRQQEGDAPVSVAKRFPELIEKKPHAANLQVPEPSDMFCTVVPQPVVPIAVDAPSRWKEYQFLEELGRGGMGVVYRARDTRLNREVAIKMMVYGECAREEDKERFLREAQAMAQLCHPNIRAVYEAGIDQERPFLVLEFVEGDGLDRRLAEKPLPVHNAADLLATLADAVEYAHSHGIIHRDLKPGNILVTAGGSPKIIDFGLAKNLREEHHLTQSGALLGTASYMAPEQARGWKDVGPAVDIYALGATLYQCLTGRPPFRAATVIDTLQQVAYEEPVRPRQLNDRIPQDIETITLKCLEKDPSRRYASAADLAADLRRFLAREPIQARRVDWVTRLRMRLARRPLEAVLLACLCALLSLGLWLVVLDNRRSRLEEQVEQLETKLGNVKQKPPSDNKAP